MQLGDKKLIVQRASIGAKNSTLGTECTPYTFEVNMQYKHVRWHRLTNYVLFSNDRSSAGTVTSGGIDAGGRRASHGSVMSSQHGYTR